MKVFVMTLGFNRTENILNAYHKFHHTNPGFKYDNYAIVDLGFPDFGNLPTIVSLAPLSVDFGFTLLKPSKNRGVSDNWNWTAWELGIEDDDILIGMDPDSDPVNPNWAKAIVDVMKMDQSIAYLGLSRSSGPVLKTEADESNRKYTIKMIGVHKVRFYTDMIAWPMGAFRGSFIRKGGIVQGRKHYGYIEHESAKKMDELGMRWAMLDEYFDNTQSKGSEKYSQWKVEQAQNRTDLDFKEWMEK